MSQQEVAAHQPSTSLPESSKLLENEKKATYKEQEGKLSYPKGAFFIIIYQFFERFNYNGMKAILPLFMRNILRFDENLSTVIYHSMTIVCYLLPILGAVIGDAYLGNFKTILYFSLLYTFGSVLLPIAAIPNFLPQAVIAMIALFIINIGSGGIRACLTAFGGDQFTCPQQLQPLETFFSIIYLVINAATLIAVFVTPILREDLECFDDDSCFALGFGVPAVAMIVALGAFIIGKTFYIMKKPHRSIISDFFACMWRGLRRRFTAKYEKHEHWLDYASDKYDRQLIEDIKQVLSVTVVFIPLPVFWALYDQQGSRWTFQATRMNGDLGGWVVKPEQMQILNPVIVMVLIPLFDHVIYPVFKKCGLLTPLQRIGSGLVLCGVSFIISAFVEINLEPTYAKIPGEGLMQLGFINTLPCNVDINYQIGTYSANLTLNPTNFATVENLPAGETIVILEAIATGDYCNNVPGDRLGNVELGIGNERSSYSVLITQRDNNMAIYRMNKEEQTEKSVSGDPLLGFYNILSGNMPAMGEVALKQGKKEVMFYYNDTSAATPPYVDYVVQTDFQEVEIRDHEVYLSGFNEPIGNVENLMQGGVYRVILFTFLNDSSPNVMTVQLTSPNTVSILWLLPQIIVVSIAEIFFAVTLITFSFTEAPERMKSVMQAISLLIIAVGNVIVIIVAEAQSGLSQKDEFFLFAGIIGIATVIFALIGVRYKYVSNDEV